MKDWLKNLKLNENNISMALGAIILLIVALVLWRYVQNTKKPIGQVSDKAATVEIASSEYVIQKGDSLWKISQDTYGSGYKWIEIYAQNKTVIGSNPDLIYPDIKLVLPKLENAKTQDYRVVKGDTLWQISTNLCGTGYSYPAIAQANNLSNPNLILPGQVLQIGCK